MTTKSRTMTQIKRKGFVVLAMAIVAGGTVFGQAPKPDPDVLELSDGEKFIGHFVSAAGGSLTFHSDGAGDVKVDWAKVKSLKSSGKFAVVQKGVVLDKHADVSKVPQGTIAAGADRNLSVDSGNGAPVVIPEANAANVVPETSFLNAFKEPKLDQDWHGTGGARY